MDSSHGRRQQSPAIRLERVPMRFLHQIANIFRRARLDKDLQDEFAAHLAFLEDDARARGLSSDEARRVARFRFGNPTAHRETAVDAVVATSLERFGKEIAFASRRLVRAPAFTTASILTLGLAIAANVAIFAVVFRVVLNPLPYPKSDRLIELDHGAHGLNVPAGVGMSRGLYYQYALRARTLEAVAVYTWDDLTIAGDGLPERLRVARATTTLASVLRVLPTLGRWFTDAEGALGAPRVAVISHSLWLRRYGADVRVLGRIVSLGGVPTTLVGVMPVTFAFPDAHIDVWLPEQMTRAMGFGVFSYNGVARLRDGVSIADARSEMISLIADLPHAFPGDPYAMGNGPEIKLFSVAKPLKDMVVGDVERGLWILLAGVVFVLCIASANVANLFLVRCEARQREVAVRSALGAGRLDIAEYFFSEGALIAAAATRGWCGRRVGRGANPCRERSRESAPVGRNSAGRGIRRVRAHARRCRRDRSRLDSAMASRERLCITGNRPREYAEFRASAAPETPHRGSGRDRAGAPRRVRSDGPQLSTTTGR